ncbi:MAG: NUDIX domain-containing protein [Anaerolineales bacterium]
MSQVLYGDRIGQEGELRIGSCAVIFDQNREKVLLTKRSDNGLWCLPGGRMEPGESVDECCRREVFEETGLIVEPKRLVGVYSSRDQLVVYKDGAKAQFVVLSFEAAIIGGALGLSNETTDAAYFTIEELESLAMHDRHKDRVLDALQDLPTPVIR